MLGLVCRVSEAATPGPRAVAGEGRCTRGAAPDGAAKQEDGDQRQLHAAEEADPDAAAHYDNSRKNNHGANCKQEEENEPEQVG